MVPNLAGQLQVGRVIEHFFWWDGFDFVEIDAEFGQSLASGFLVGLAGLGIAASVVALAFGFFAIELFASAWRKVERLHDDVRGAANLLRRQQFAAGHILARRKLLKNSGTEQLAQNCHEQMAMDATPAAALEMVQTEFFALIAHQFLRVSLPPARCPAKFPDFAAAMSLFDAILLRRLFAKRG